MAKVKSPRYNPKVFFGNSANFIIFAKTLVVKIAVNTRLVVKEKMDGIGWFTLETMSRIAQNHPEHTFCFLFDRKPNPSFQFSENVIPVVVQPITRLPALLKFWNSVSVPLILKKLKPDLYLSPDGFLPPNPSAKAMVVIHDLNFEHFPEFIPKQYRAFYHKWVRRSASAASKILTVSQFSKDDIVGTFQIEPEKIDVVYSGLNRFIEPPSNQQLTLAKQTYGLDQPYFIVPGTLHPRKNIHGTIRAFSRFRQSSNTSHKLVFAGNKKGMTPDMRRAFNESQVKNDIIFTGRITDSVMNSLIWGADALLFMSLYEGFGLPLLEAAAAGIPAITSSASSMPEIADGTALLVDPLNVEEMANAMARIVHDRFLRHQLVSASASLTDRYSWDRTAYLTWQSIEKLL